MVRCNPRSSNGIATKRIAVATSRVSMAASIENLISEARGSADARVSINNSRHPTCGRSLPKLRTQDGQPDLQSKESGAKRPRSQSSQFDYESVSESTIDFPAMLL